MKIGLISGEFPPMPGGVGDFTRILAENLQARGHSVFVLSRAGSVSARLPVSTVAGWGAGCLLEIRRWARRCSVDLVNLQFQTAAYDMSPFIHFAPDVVGAPVVTTFHDLRYPYLFPKAGPIRGWFVMRLARASRGVIATNREDALRLRPTSRRQVIPIGSSIKRSPPSASQRAGRRAQIAGDDNPLLLGHFGFVRPIKGVDYLVEALARLRSCGTDARLVFIGARSNIVDDGADSRYLLALEESIRRHGLEDAVHWTGYLSDEEASAWFGAVDLVVLPYVDGASFRRSSLIAALHQGCAIITTEPALEEPAFAHGENLWLTPPRSSEAIENAVLQLLAKPQQLAALRAGARRLSQTFDWERITRDTISFYQSCL
ncbi:MAG: glycosyltransferase family 4 protein [Chloroflexi bacterium]|nr:glycosyltransferase family 4 protein [Chloroflexota bacterium]